MGLAVAYHKGEPKKLSFRETQSTSEELEGANTPQGGGERGDPHQGCSDPVDKCRHPGQDVESREANGTHLRK